MNYTAKLPDDSVNISNENPIVTVLKLLVSLALSVIVIYILLITAINYLVSSITTEQEQKIMSLFTIDSNSTLKSGYLNSIVHKLEGCTDLPYDIKIDIIDQKEPNAFAVPGGLIYITKGMLKKVDSENELAFIIGHELGHFKNRDHLRALGYRLVLALVSMVLGSDYGFVANTTLDITGAKYSQSAELDADSFGLDIMNCTYHSVSGATKIFKKMDDGDEWRYFMATHPSFKERIKIIESNIHKSGYDTTKALLPLGKI